MHVLQADCWTWLVRIHAAFVCIVQQPEDVPLKNPSELILWRFNL